MQKRIINSAGISIAVIHSDAVIISDGQSALDLIMSVFYNDNCAAIAINKEALCDDFFVLSTGVAGEILQKVSNYRMMLAIIGDFGGYTSRPLRDFMYECNNGIHVYFVGDEATAIEKLTGRTGGEGK